MENVKIPTLLINSKQNLALFHYLTDCLEELLPDTRRILIPVDSHLMYEENPSAYNTEVMAFLNQVN